MGAWTKATASPRPRRTAGPPTSTEAGILRAEELARYTALQRYPCVGDLGYWVEHYWSLSWDLPAGTAYESHTLPHPACTLSVERGATRPGVGDDPVVVTGVATRRFDVTVAGHGWVVAAKFRPGGLAALSGRGVRDLRDRVTPAREVFGPALADALAGLDESTAVEECVRWVEATLTRLPAHPDERYEQVLRIVADMLAHRELVRVAQVEERHGLSTRALQRLFGHYVGVSPKWVLARYRMHDAVTDLDSGYDDSLADLAAALGWYDQAHFTRNFVALVGVTPGQYRARLSRTNDVES